MVDWNANTKPNLSMAKTNSHISLVVLTNEFTYSSATMLAVFAQDGKLGTVIGYPSANSPSCYGDVLSFQLKNSGTKGQVSFKRWLRPNANADQRMLHPDILVPIGGDALQTAIKFLDHQ
ncbi:MAG TPA: S41 family peptidase [Ruminiclostridium sp.]|nr:S41 family peptidase [Ruminiclostridium sp.]